ncbi:hypothetical protein BDV36DRAFT_290310 [Aspergillus pseudocaelatus]|uniref:Uncharacterized protein n=1 Tax=Aspergillus pseudocaelatus TaxID=1825620 RepID=A0ABQ6X2W5_9EURO|nr:hypothetical protein BDV36DRAFT_290310 [Aspergillus pseudocaelatus]
MTPSYVRHVITASSQKYDVIEASLRAGSAARAVLSPLRRTGRPPKNRDNNAATQREKAASAQSSTANSLQNHSPRDTITQKASPDRTFHRHRPPQDATTANDVPTACSPARLQQPLTEVAACSAVPGGAVPAVHSMNNAVSQDLTQIPALSVANLDMGVSPSDFSALDMDLDPDMGMWEMPSMPDLAMDHSHGDIGSTAMAGSQTDEIGHLPLGSVISSPTITLDTHEPGDCAHRAQNKPPTTLMTQRLCGQISAQLTLDLANTTNICFTLIYMEKSGKEYIQPY